MVTCLGHKHGTACYHVTPDPQHSVNWEKWQLCYKCAIKLHPEYYYDKRDHGVNKSETLAKDF